MTTDERTDDRRGCRPRRPRAAGSAARGGPGGGSRRPGRRRPRDPVARALLLCCMLVPIAMHVHGGPGRPARAGHPAPRRARCRIGALPPG